MIDALIAVVDDDESLRDSLKSLLRALGHSVVVFSSAESFLSSDVVDKTDCLIIDVHMPGMSGPDLQRELRGRHSRAPIIFMTAHSDEEAIARVMADGAVACLFKPFSEEALLNALGQALAG